MAPLTLGTAGHVDHGKTALVEALTGKNTDRLAEEHRRGISIELGYAELVLPSGRSLSVIDVPGHEALVRTMVAGATGIDLFLMVVAADEGVMPQTREHLTVLEALDVRVGVVALSRCDLAEPKARELAAAEARETIDAPLVEVSARTGEGLDELRAILARVADRAEAERETSPWEEPAVLHVDRVFTLRGIGTVVTGTLWSGAIRARQRVEVLPGGIELRVRGVQIHDRSVERAEAGQRVALNLSGPGRDRVSRGDVVASAGAGLKPTYRLDVRLQSPLELREEERRVQVHHGTRRVSARVVKLEGDRLAQLRLESPLVARSGDRFVVRRSAPVETLGGGAVLDPNPPRHGPGAATDRLRMLLEAEPEELLAIALDGGADRSARPGRGEGGIPSDPEDWSGWPILGPARGRHAPERWRQAIDALLADRRVERRNGRLVPAQAEDTEPSEPRVALDERALRLRELIRADGPAPRAPGVLAGALGCERREAEAALESLVAAGQAVRVKPGVYYEAATLERLRERLLDAAAAAGGGIALPEARDLLGTSRKYAQALLEHLDSCHLTIRHGDRHLLRNFNRVGRQGSGGPPGPQSQ